MVVYNLWYKNQLINVFYDLWKAQRFIVLLGGNPKDYKIQKYRTNKNIHAN